MNSYLKSIDVWERTDSQIIRYRCFELIPLGGFCVQSADFYSAKTDPQKSFLDQQFLELLTDQNPMERNKVFPSLEEAIEAHKQEFS